MNPFSFEEYKVIVEKIQSYLPLMGYKEALNKDKFFILRHDVEFSVERAYDLALFEKENGIFSNYFFQIRNNCYNLFSSKNILLIQNIKKMGHNIGLHAHMGFLDNIKNIDKYIIGDCDVMSKLTGIKIDSFSFHRPKKEYLALNLKIKGIINAYQDKYFTFTGNIKNREIFYTSDSNHQWKWGSPLNKNLSKYNKIQLLIHPYSWTKKGYNNENNFSSLLMEKDIELRKSINEEIVTFPKTLL